MDFEILFMFVFAIIGILCLLGFYLNDFYYYDKYKKMVKFNYFLLNVYAKPDDSIKNKIFNQFYDYLKKEQKQKQKEFEKKLKKEFKKNIKNDMDYIC